MAATSKSRLISKVMRANKGKDTKPEKTMRAALRAVGLRGYRKHWERIPGKPDIVYPSRRIAIFVNGCFWHRCPACNLSLPKSNVEFWKTKFENNKQRDARNKNDLEKLGWKVFVVWECELKEDSIGCALRIKEHIDGSHKTIGNQRKKSEQNDNNKS